MFGRPGGRTGVTIDDLPLVDDDAEGLMCLTAGVEERSVDHDGAFTQSVGHLLHPAPLGLVERLYVLGIGDSLIEAPANLHDLWGQPAGVGLVDGCVKNIPVEGQVIDQADGVLGEPAASEDIQVACPPPSAASSTASLRAPPTLPQ